MIGIQVHFFGPAGDLAGMRSADVEVASPATLGDVRAVIEQRFPAFRGKLSTMRLALNESFAADETPVSAGDVVAVIPPVSGGADDDHCFVELVRGTIDRQAVRAFVEDGGGSGGIVTFEGATRAEQDPVHGPLVRLEYEAYDGMAERVLRQLAEEARQRSGAGRVAVVHRLGAVAPGEVSVMIAVACPHRAEAFEACRWLIDTLKREVPIWKKDVFSNGATRWVDPTSARREGELLTPPAEKGAD